MSADEAADLLHCGFKVEGRLSSLATEKDDTFRVDARDGRRYVLKIANPSEDPLEIDLQIKLLLHVATVDADIPVPRLVHDVDGRASFTKVDRAGQNRCVRLMSYLEGTPLDSTGSTAQERFRVGEALGRLRHATAGFSHPADLRVIAWDVKHLPSLRPLLDRVEDASRRKRLAQGMDRFATVQDRLGTLRTQVLHNDFSKSNIVVDHGDPKFVTGIIDFGDAVRTAVAIDVSTALLNQLPRNAAETPVENLFDDARDVLRGYLSVAELTEAELRLIPHLVMGRVIGRALITLWRAKVFPENSAYIIRNTEQGWAQLDWFLGRSVDEVSSTLV
jgi:Ser/Thr protein kinase RdoA (MazF antagonist)